MRVTKTKTALIGTTALLLSSASSFAAEFETTAPNSTDVQRVGICDMVQSGGFLSQDEVLAKACAAKADAGVEVAMSVEPQAIQSDAQTDESLASVMQQIRQNQNGNTDVQSEPVVLAAPEPAVFQPASVSTSTGTRELSSALGEIRQALPESSATPAKLWFVGVYR